MLCQNMIFFFSSGIFMVDRLFNRLTLKWNRVWIKYQKLYLVAFRKIGARCREPFHCKFLDRVINKRFSCFDSFLESNFILLMNGIRTAAANIIMWVILKHGFPGVIQKAAAVIVWNPLRMQKKKRFGNFFEQ